MKWVLKKYLLDEWTFFFFFYLLTTLQALFQVISKQGTKKEFLISIQCVGEAGNKQISGEMYQVSGGDQC